MDVVRLLELRETPLGVDEVLAAVADPSAGGTAVFVGTVRELDGGRAVVGLGYSAHPSAGDELRRVVESVAVGPGVIAVAAVHRVGELVVGDVAVIVAAAGVHRGEAFRACQLLIDELKHRVPIWKHQRFADGTEEWVGVDC